MATLVSPNGSPITVPDTVADDYIAQGYKHPGQLDEASDTSSDTEEPVKRPKRTRSRTPAPPPED